MVRKTHNKLVRDRIPDILKSQNIRFGIEEMSQADYCQALRSKLIDEATEVSEAVEANLVAELADLYEVIDATMSVYGIRRNEVLACQMKRKTNRGAFYRKFRLLWTEA